MKTLIQKELRENFKWALLGLLVWTVLLVMLAQSYGNVVRYLDPAEWDRLQPLTSSVFLTEATWLCAVLGLLIGWFQIYNETHHDLWAFLVHRPVKPTRIFLAKIAAGTCLYALAAGLPILCFVAWIRSPGHVAAPFEWKMVLPLASHFLAGIVYYFAGMLTAIRQARWCASRGLGLGVALTSSGALFLPIFPWNLLIIVLCGAVLAIAVWGAFHSGGHSEPQPILGKLALTTALVTGAAVVLFGIATGLLGTIISNRSFSWSNYVMTRDGAIYKQIQRAGQPPEIVDLNGNRATDPKTGRIIGPDGFNRRAASFLWATVYSDEQTRKMLQAPLFTYWGENSGILWYFWNRYGVLAGYDRITRRFVGTLGPNGFTPNLSVSGVRFVPAKEHYAMGFSRTLATATALYELDLDNRATRVLFQTTIDDPIEATKDELLTGYDWNALVVTRRFVHLLSADGTVLLKQPYEPSRSQTGIRVFFLEPAGQFALWVTPDSTGNVIPQNAPPTQVIWVGRDQGIIKRAELPTLGWYNPTPPLWETLVSSLCPPGLVVALRIFTARDSAAQIEWKTILISVATAVFICVPIGWWLGRRYNFTKTALFGWLAFLLLSGLPGLLAFLSVHDWPARVSCPNCGKLRAVDLDRCQHCGAQFPPPDKTGIEIFEPLTNP